MFSTITRRSIPTLFTKANRSFSACADIKKVKGIFTGLTTPINLVPAGASPGTGMWFPMSVGNGLTVKVLQNNNFMIGASGAIVMEKLSSDSQTTVGFIGTGDINKNMARGAATVRPYNGLVYGSEGAQDFADELNGELGDHELGFNVDNDDLEPFCGKCDVIFTQDSAKTTLAKLQTAWFKDAALIIHYGDKASLQEAIISSSRTISEEDLGAILNGDEKVSEDTNFTIVNLPKKSSVSAGE